MKIKLNALLDDFQNYLIDTCHYPENTSKWYAQSYTKTAIIQLLISWFKNNGLDNPFNEFNESKSNSVKRSFVISISESVIENEIKELSLGKSKKTIRNWRSGLRSFFSFLESENYFFETNKSNNDLMNNLQNLGGAIKYSQKELFDVFWSRLITQDRAYEHMIYPARVLNLIFNSSKKKADYFNLLEQIICNTKFWVDEGKTSIMLKDIDSLIINYSQCINGNVSIVFSGKEYPIFTENTRNIHNPFEKIQAIGLDDLSLDHDIPLQNILDNKKAQKKYPILKDLSDSYSEFANGGAVVSNYLLVKNIRDFKNFSPKFYAKNKLDFDDEFVKSLYNNMMELYKDISFTIMLKSYNSSKGKGI